MATSNGRSVQISGSCEEVMLAHEVYLPRKRVSEVGLVRGWTTCGGRYSKVMNFETGWNTTFWR